ncbi:uncharacterized protein APUU_31334S [Aspergillus puulaauensis]|uniref:Uncharacterized protein n=1 Tax=Aspergillus puulaauensis TaxID=1220207 RepID=A0A7R8AKQ6_9EURO|nr:uncharacterized protein APUU_31334S [Aspergillus puulaauensis]BCS23109.1 hypothetical protein APUU_31334S [Aspergillus puulaauensis]
MLDSEVFHCIIRSESETQFNSVSQARHKPNHISTTFLLQTIYLFLYIKMRAVFTLPHRPAIRNFLSIAQPYSYGYGSAASSMARAFSAAALFSVVVLPFVPPAVMSAKANGGKNAITMPAHPSARIYGQRGVRMV